MKKCIVAFIALVITAVGATFGLAVRNTCAYADEDVVKVVNVTDGSYKLKTGEYSFENGELSVSETYLKTLEENTEYTFRVVTASDDYDLKVRTDFEAVTLTPEKEEFTKGENVSFKVNGSVSVTKLEINGDEYAFTADGNVITLSSESLKNLTGGTHTVKAYTSLGRPTASFDYAGLPDYRAETVEAVSHVFLWVDFAVFATLIVGYAAYAVVKRLTKNKRG